MGSTIVFVIRTLALSVLLLSGCFFDLSVSPESACLNLCDCVSATPAQEDQCVTECTQNIDETVPQECLECVGTSSCEVFEDLSTACAAECQGATSLIVED